MESLERMQDFFAARIDSYDNHMLECVEGCQEAYQYMATLIPKSASKLLDLGCGTGLELDEIFKVNKDVEVTGIDLTQSMLDKLKSKHPDRALNLICGSYFDVPLGKDCFDCAISFQTLHHFSHEMKLTLYKRIHRSLKSNGLYIECDYMVEKQSEEDFYFKEKERLCKAQSLSDDAFYHYDTPCTITNQIKLLSQAGYKNIRQIFRIENTTMLIAYK